MPLVLGAAITSAGRIAAAHNREHFAGKCNKACSIAIFILYPQLTKTVFLTFVCDELDDGSRWLNADLSISCASSQHVAARSYAFFMLFIYPLGAPLLYAYLLFVKYGKQLHRISDIEARRIALIKGAMADDRYARWDATTSERGALLPRHRAAVAAEEGLDLVHAQGLAPFVVDSVTSTSPRGSPGGNSSSNEFLDLLHTMRVLPNPNSRDPNETRPLSTDEWEAASVYCTVVFRRKP